MREDTTTAARSGHAAITPSGDDIGHVGQQDCRVHQGAVQHTGGVPSPAVRVVGVAEGGVVCYREGWGKVVGGGTATSGGAFSTLKMPYRYRGCHAAPGHT